MSTTRSQKRKNNQQESTESVSEGFVSPIIANNSCPVDQDVSVAGPSRPKSPRIENSFLESMRASLKDEITSELKNLLVNLQKELLNLLKPETRDYIRENTEDETENGTRSFYTPKKSVRIKSIQNNDPCSSRYVLHVFSLHHYTTSRPKRNAKDDQPPLQTTEEDTYGSTKILTSPTISPSNSTQSKST